MNCGKGRGRIGVFDHCSPELSGFHVYKFLAEVMVSENYTKEHNLRKIQPFNYLLLKHCTKECGILIICTQTNEQ